MYGRVAAFTVRYPFEEYLRATFTVFASAAGIRRSMVGSYSSLNRELRSSFAIIKMPREKNGKKFEGVQPRVYLTARKNYYAT